MDKENIDLKGVYMWRNCSSYEIGEIKTINKQSVTMCNGTKIKFENFDKIYKLNDAEVELYRLNLIKNLKRNKYVIEDFRNNLTWLKGIVKTNKFVKVDTEALQEAIDKLTEELNTVLPNVFEINGIPFSAKFGKCYEYSE